VSEEEKVLDANQRFYLALEKLNLDDMDAIWLHEDWVACLHPGWELLVGWDAIRESWQRIFENTRRMKVAVSEVNVQVEGSAAWVNCVEQVTSSFETGFSTAWVQATNLFVKRDAGWRLVHHHASPLPRGDEEETVQ
jgi:ketosteroid isomerase-like protein